MSHHKHVYCIYPYDGEEYSADQWKRADQYLNGVEFKVDFSEAVSLARLAAVSCRIPFIVESRPLGGIKPALVDYWVVSY